MVVYKLADGMRVRKKGADLAYVENVVTNTKFKVEGSGVYILGLIDGKRDLDDILDEMLKTYGPDVHPYTVAQDLGQFIGNLIEEGIIQYVKSTRKSKKDK